MKIWANKKIWRAQDLHVLTFSFDIPNAADLWRYTVSL